MQPVRLEIRRGGVDKAAGLGGLAPRAGESSKAGSGQDMLPEKTTDRLGN
ncbi:hypothetical protein PY32053_02509 [Paracoccus yeei]|uniref:Uncharacterized protein n=1 Tax=Paracoccus yeei TaxID=147645 RepID=A0A386UNS6_9RHOB|nr:hypothetical protein PY32053_02509 [Paracoccus yeei]